VTSIRKILANRANARRSTGPKTGAGKTRSSRNALRHGFGRSVLCTGGYSRDVEALALAIAGQDASGGRYEQACRVAAAQLYVLQVRRAKHDLQTAANFGYDVCDGGDRTSPDCTSPDGKSPDCKSPDCKSPNWTLLQPISRLDRYEQRALTRRRRAMRDFDALCREEKAARNFCRTKPTGENAMISTRVPPGDQDDTGNFCKTNPTHEAATISAPARPAEAGVARNFCRTKPTGENPADSTKCSDTATEVANRSMLGAPAVTQLNDAPQDEEHLPNAKAPAAAGPVAAYREPRMIACGR
jgi:hypothetical protein